MIKEIRSEPNNYRPSCPKRMLVLSCDVCHNLFERKFTQHYVDTHKWGHFCSRKCYGTYRSQHSELYAENTSMMHTPESAAKISTNVQKRMSHPGYVHPWTGREHSAETKKRFSEVRIERGLAKGEKNGMFGRKHTKKAKEMMSEKQADLLVHGLQRPYGKNSQRGLYHPVKASREAKYKSGWEFVVMKYLDLDPNVVSWEYEPLRISYMYNDNKRWYVPDFVVTFLDGHREMWEVKPKEFICAEKTLLKTSAAQVWCAENGIESYKMITGDDLRERKII